MTLNLRLSLRCLTALDWIRRSAWARAHGLTCIHRSCARCLTDDASVVPRIGGAVAGLCGDCSPAQAHSGLWDVYPNLFIVWLATPLFGPRTTALDVARKLARRVFPHLLAPQDTTIESFLADLAGTQPLNFDALPKDDQDLWRAERNFSAQRG